MCVESILTNNNRNFMYYTQKRNSTIKAWNSAEVIHDFGENFLSINFDTKKNASNGTANRIVILDPKRLSLFIKNRKNVSQILLESQDGDEEEDVMVDFGKHHFPEDNTDNKEFISFYSTVEENPPVFVFELKSFKKLMKLINKINEIN